MARAIARYSLLTERAVQIEMKRMKGNELEVNKMNRDTMIIVEYSPTRID